MQTVRDIMNADVVTIRQGASVGELVRLLDEQGIGGMPVVDAEGTVVGVVSRTDVIRLATRDPELPRAGGSGEGLGRGPLMADADDPNAYFVGLEGTSGALEPDADSFQGQLLQDIPVDEIMTPVAFSVRPDMPVPELARFLLNGHIHRALVVGEGRLVGIVSAFDVLRTVAEG